MPLRSRLHWTAPLAASRAASSPVSELFAKTRAGIGPVGAHLSSAPQLLSVGAVQGMQTAGRIQEIDLVAELTQWGLSGTGSKAPEDLSCYGVCGHHFVASVVQGQVFRKEGIAAGRLADTGVFPELLPSGNADGFHCGGSQTSQQDDILRVGRDIVQLLRFSKKGYASGEAVGFPAVKMVAGRCPLFTNQQEPLFVVGERDDTVRASNLV